MVSTYDLSRLKSGHACTEVTLVFSPAVRYTLCVFFSCTLMAPNVALMISRWEMWPVRVGAPPKSLMVKPDVIQYSE